MSQDNTKHILSRFQSDWSAAQQAKDPNAPFCTLSTVDSDGFPRSRIVGLREIDTTTEAFLVFGNKTSPKFQDLAATSKYELTTFWTKPTMIQYRISGHVWRTLDDQEMESKWHKKPKRSQLLDYYYTHYQPQSSVLEGGRAQFLETMEQLKQQFANKPIPVQPTNAGLVLEPFRIEEWRGDVVERLHERYLYQKTERARQWQKQTLVP